jgi:cytochrome c-type biogenesis protein
MLELLDIVTAFVLGLLTPITAVCVLPLYPGFLAYLSGQVTQNKSRLSTGRRPFIMLGIIVSIGVIMFMLALGLIFTTFLQVSLTAVIGIVSPIAFGVLAIISILLMADIDIGSIFPKTHAPLRKSPYQSAFIFGLFFGAIVIPCNPLFIAALLTRTATVTGFLENIVNFMVFGFGIAFPLLVFSILSGQTSGKIIGFLTSKKRKINLVAGAAMFVISLYYLIFVFRLLG